MTSFTVDPWDPGYGVAFANDDNAAAAPSPQQLVLDVELPAKSWAPITPAANLHRPSALLFCDGVRRIDARIWIHGDGPQPAPGIAASYAAGLVCCNDEAHIVDTRVERGLFTASPDAVAIKTARATYPARASAGNSPDDLTIALQRSLAEIEMQVALNFRAREQMTDDLVVVDGPLRGRTHVPRMVGYIKTHQAAYLPEDQAAVVAALQSGERTPVFTIGTSWTRRSWYLRLPGPSTAPWSGVVRLECSVDLPTDAAIELADMTAVLLPGMASQPHKDPRAPQNLVPIGGLERQLKHRLGDQKFLYRALRSASVAAKSSIE